MSTRPCIYKHFSTINIGSVSAYVQGFRLSQSLASPHKDSLGSRFCTYTHAAFTVLRRFYITGFPAPLCTTHKVCTQIYFKIQIYHSVTRAIFQWTNFVVPGRLELPPPEFSSGTLTTKLQDFPYWRKVLQAFPPQPLWTFALHASVDLYKFRESVFIILAKLCSSTWTIFMASRHHRLCASLVIAFKQNLNTICDPCGARTRDPDIKSVVLYRLS